MPGPEVLPAARARLDRALTFIANVHEPIMNTARVLFYFVGKSLMVDEASTSLQHVEAIYGEGCAAISAMFDHYEFPSTHDRHTAAVGGDFAFMKP